MWSSKESPWIPTCRDSYLIYLGGSAATGGIFSQLCVWMGAVAGAISDTEYLESSGMVKAQNEFQRNDNSPEILFTNMIDKGYRSISSAWRQGGQLQLQP